VVLEYHKNEEWKNEKLEYHENSQGNEKKKGGEGTFAFKK
jgi:hypothetical protein